MWYTANKTGKAEDKHEKRLREARQTIKWSPCFAIIVLIAALVGGINFGKHPDVEHLLRLIFPIGATLYFLSLRKKAQATLTGTRETLLQGNLLLGLLLMASGPSLGDMWHHKQMTLFYTFGTATLAVSLFCLALMIWDWVGCWRAGHHS